MTLLARVVEVRELALRVKSFTFARFDKKPFASFKAGAHLNLTLADPARGVSMTRAYSLTSGPNELDRYEIAVLLPEIGGAGSAFMHESVKAGRAFNIGDPVESFGLSTTAGHHVMIAGGIGITPFVSMVKELKAAGASFELHFIGRDTSSMAFLADLKTACGPLLITYQTRGKRRARPDLQQIVKPFDPGSHLYVCGPAELNLEVLKAARARDWPDDHLHCESFSGSVAADDKEFTVYLAKARKEFRIAPGQSILDALLQAGLSVPYDCKHGTCGACTTAVVEGKPSHRDAVYSNAANASDEHMRICVSRAVSALLVLDI